MMAADPGVDAIAICRTQPIGRLALIQEALDHGLDVLIEKPPAATISEASGAPGWPAAPDESSATVPAIARGRGAGAGRRSIEAVISGVWNTGVEGGRPRC